MDKKIMEKIEEGFCKVLHEYAETGMRGAQDVEVCKAAVSGVLKLKMLEEMEKYGGYSERGYRDGSYRGYRDDGASQRGYRDDGGSYRGYRDGGSYDDGKEALRKKLEEMKNSATPENRRMIDEWLHRLEQH